MREAPPPPSGLVDSERPCEACGKPLERRRFPSQLEPRLHFVARRYCSIDCALPRRPPVDKDCELCGVRLSQAAAKRGNKTCSRACASERRRRHTLVKSGSDAAGQAERDINLRGRPCFADETKPCARCTQPMSSRRPNGRRMAASTWARAKLCPACLLGPPAPVSAR